MFSTAKQSNWAVSSAALPYLNTNLDDESVFGFGEGFGEERWDASTLASTPSVRARFMSGEKKTTIVRNNGEPQEIIFSVPFSKKKILREKFRRAVHFLICLLRLMKKSDADEETEELYQSTELRGDGLDVGVSPTAVLV